MLLMFIFTWVKEKKVGFKVFEEWMQGQNMESEVQICVFLNIISRTNV